MVSLTVILFSTKCFLFVDIYIDLLKLKAYKVFESSDADLSWLLFLKKPTDSPSGLTDVLPFRTNLKKIFLLLAFAQTNLATLCEKAV